MEYCSKAIILKAFGSYDCLCVDKYPLEPLHDGIEVAISHCGLNFADLYTRQGLFSNRSLPLVLGIESVGVIKAIGYPNETSLKVGQRVVCYNSSGGLFQDVIRVSQNNVYPLPDYIPSEVGAALFVNYLTAYFTLFEIGNLKPNETVFIQSCAGGVGFASVQLAKTVDNVTLIGTTSNSKESTMKKAGVDHILSYDNVLQNLKELYPNGIDLIIDNQGGNSFNDLQSLLKPLGRIVAIGANSLIQGDQRISMIDAIKLWWNTKHIPILSLIEENRIVAGLHLGVLAEKEPAKVRKALEIIYDLYKKGKISPIIDSIWPFESVVEASKVLGERRNVGKVLLVVDEDKE